MTLARAGTIVEDAPYPAPEAIVERYPSREAWLAGRRTGIGGSDAGALWGESSFGNPFSLYTSKVADGGPDIDEEWLEIGNEIEPAIANLYGRRSGRVVFDPGRTTIYRSKVWPWMIASLDRIGGDLQRGRHVVVECKNRGAFSAREWREGPPLDVQFQVQHQLAVTGFQAGDIAVLKGGNQFEIIEVERDEELIELHVEKCRAFWFEQVVPRRPPPVDGTEQTRHALARLYPEARLPSIALPTQADAWMQQREAAIAAEKLATAQRREAENHLRAAIGDAELGLLPSGGAFTLKTIRKKAYEVPATSYRELRFKPPKENA